MKNVLSVAACASLALITACAENEVKVAMTDLPPAARATLDKEAAGGKITEVEKKVTKGQTVYSADIVQNGKAWDVVVAEDGRLISKEAD